MISYAHSQTGLICRQDRFPRLPSVPMGGMLEQVRHWLAGQKAGRVAQNPPGYSETKEAHLKRLRRIEGQIRGLQRMVETDVYCIDVLTQVSAATNALQSVALLLLEEHLRHCVTHAIQAGGQDAEDKVKEASAAIARLVRS